MRKWIALAAVAGLLMIAACDTADTENPTVSIVFPANGATVNKGDIVIKAVATDNKGVTKVEFSIGGTVMGTDNNGAADTFQYTWTDTAAQVVGHSYDLVAKAYDAAENTKTSTTVAITIAGGGGGSGPTHHDHNIDADETWYASGNIHYVDATIGVINNATLTIKPGCIVKFTGDYELRCGYGGQQGAIVAVGTADSLITFTSNATVPGPGDWSEIGVYQSAGGSTQFKYCKFEYAGSSAGYGTIYVYGTTTKVDYCSISHSADGGAIAEGEAKFSSFTNNTIATCAKYPVSIQAANGGTIGAGNTLTGNASGYDAIELYANTVTETQTWLNHGVPYVIMNSVSVNGANSPILTIAAGNTVKLGPDVEFRCGYGGAAGAITAIGTASAPITFTSSAVVPAPGSWSEIGVYGDATNATQFTYCNFSYAGSSAGYGAFYVYASTPKFDHCNVSQCSDYGVVVEGEGKFASFTNNTVTTCAKYAVNIQANYAGTLGAGNTLTGNASGYDGIEVEGDNVIESQTWLNHGVPYIIKASTNVSGGNSPELTIAPGTTVKFRPGVELYCGYSSQSGAIIADGTSGRITFTASATPPSPGSWNNIGFYEGALSSSKLVNCTIEYGGSDYGNIYTYNSTPTISNDSIGHSGKWGIYLDGTTYPDPSLLRSNNTFYDDASGDINK